MLLAEHSPSVTQELGLSVGYAETRVPRNEVEPGPCGGGGGGFSPTATPHSWPGQHCVPRALVEPAQLCFFWPQDLARQPLLADLLLHTVCPGCLATGSAPGIQVNVLDLFQSPSVPL